jgi:hypothetical protein
MRLILGMVLVGVACAAGCARKQDKPVVIVCDGPGSMHVSDDAPPAGEAFQLPADVGGKALGKVLPPTGRPGVLENPSRTAPAEAPAPKLAVLRPTLPEMPPPSPKVPELGKGPRPRTVTEEALDEGFGTPALPERPGFEPGEKAKEPSESVHVPPPLPYLAAAPADRVPLDDPTLEASTAAVLAAPLPERTTPLPFVRLSVPEPFEWRIPLLTKAPDEATTPRGPTPTKP